METDKKGLAQIEKNLSKIIQSFLKAKKARISGIARNKKVSYEAYSFFKII